MAGSAIKGVSLCSTTSISVIFPSATVTSSTSLPPNPSALPRWVPSPTLIANVGLPAASPDSACSTAANTALLVAVAPLTASTGPWASTMAGRSFSMAGSAIKGVSLCSTTSISVIFPSATVTSSTSLPPNPSALPRWVPSPTLMANPALAAASTASSPDSASSTAANTAPLVAVAPLTASTLP